MNFRTEVDPGVSPWKIDAGTRIQLLGSCFADAIGGRLVRDGFNAVANPLGPLYNPVSLARLVRRCAEGYEYALPDLCPGPRGFHCMDFASRYSGPDAQTVIDGVRSDLRKLSPRPEVLVLTFGTAWVFEMQERGIVGNCHKFDSRLFRRRRLSVSEIVDIWEPILNDKIAGHVIFTVSPIRHLADGLHGNQLSKATLLLAVEALCSTGKAEYFPAYEMLMDDLRDYRFYAPDMKHPSEIAEDYVYETFLARYCAPAAIKQARERRKAARAAQHKTILQ